jgi:hypothetical protein
MSANHTAVNIGNARLYNLEADLGIEETNQYQLAVSILFVTVGKQDYGRALRTSRLIDDSTACLKHRAT